MSEKRVQYAAAIAAAIMGCLDHESDNYIDQDDFDATAFVHAMGNMAPNMIYRHITGDEQDNLGFNHICNRLCLQFTNKKVASKTKEDWAQQGTKHINGWLDFESNKELFNQEAKKNCLCKFEDGTVIRYSEEHPIERLIQFKLAEE